MQEHLENFVDVETGTWLALSAALLAAWLAWVRFERSRPRRGFGSGENASWNRRIRVDRPAHPELRERPPRAMRFAWRYVDAGAGAVPLAGGAAAGDTNPRREVTAGGTTALFARATATDATSGCELSGNFVGRQTWQPVQRATAAALAAQARLSASFDVRENPNGGDKVLRAQLLAANGGDAADAVPPAPRGAVPGAGAGAGIAPRPPASPPASPTLFARASQHVSARAALELGWSFFFKLQCADGHWAGDYGGPHFLLPGLVLACFVSGYDLGDARCDAMACYMRNHQQSDGGWGLHIEGPSTLFGTIMNYMALRCLGAARSGLSADEDAALQAQAFVRLHGGAMMSPQWGKFWMAVLNVCHWDAVNPIPPECWLLPRWFPFHPGKMWCHSRMPYLPMSFIYGARKSHSPPHPLAFDLRRELLGIETEAQFAAIDWDAARNTVADIDLYAPHTQLMDVLLGAYRVFERLAPRWLRDPIAARGLRFAMDYVHAEDLHTNFVDIGPVNKVVNMLACFFEGGRECEAFRRHCARIDDYLWVAEDGMKMQGYNGSQLWDTAFATQALAVSGLASRYPEQVARIYAFLDATQVKEDVPERTAYFRTISKGGWPFSTSDHGWPIADCTAEGLKATLLIDALCASGQADVGSSVAAREADGRGTLRSGALAPRRLCDAVDVILALRNPDGGWATYEETRGGAWYELLNPIESFGDIMIDYTYTELTSSALQGLVAFQRRFPGYRAAEVTRAIGRGVEYVRQQQREDGSFYGS